MKRKKSRAIISEIMAASKFQDIDICSKSEIGEYDSSSESDKRDVSCTPRE